MPPESVYFYHISRLGEGFFFQKKFRKILLRTVGKGAQMFHEKRRKILFRTVIKGTVRITGTAEKGGLTVWGEHKYFLLSAIKGECQEKIFERGISEQNDKDDNGNDSHQSQDCGNKAAGGFSAALGVEFGAVSFGVNGVESLLAC